MRNHAIPDRFPALGWQRAFAPASHPRIRLCCKRAGDTDVDTSLEVAVGTLVACHSANQALTCRWALACRSPVDALVLAVHKTARNKRRCLRSERRKQSLSLPTFRPPPGSRVLWGACDGATRVRGNIAEPSNPHRREFFLVSYTSVTSSLSCVVTPMCFFCQECGAVNTGGTLRPAEVSVRRD